MKTHIALVGGQPIPVYLGIKSSGVLDKIILVYSEQTKDEAERLISCFEEIPSKMILCNPVDLEDIEICANKILTEVRDDEVILNLTSGTKPWTLVFYHVFMAVENSHFILVDQNNQIQDLHTHEVKEETIDREMRFKLYGSKLTHFTRFSDYTDEDLRNMKEVEKIRKKYTKLFNKLTISKSSLSHKGCSKKTKNGSYVEWDKEKGIVRLFLFNFYKHMLVEHCLMSKHIVDIVFNSGWFELKTAYELSKNPVVKEVLMNCKFVAKDNQPKNEFDVILDMGKKLFFVECKTQFFDITAIDKFHSGIKNYSGTSSKGIFVVNDKPSTRKRTYLAAKEKCRDNNILIFNFEEKKLNPSLPSLNEIINQDLNKTNKR